MSQKRHFRSSDHDGDTAERVVSEASPCVVGVAVRARDIPLLARMLAEVPEDSEAAYVVLIDGDEEAVPPAEAIAACTSMPARTIGGAAAIMPHTIYVAPADGLLALRDGALEIWPAPTPEANNASVDHFFRSLAGARKERAIGVILSGDGSDGILGIRAIEAEGGITLVHKPEEEDTGTMPRNAIRSGVIDYVVAAERIPAIIDRYARHPYVQAGDVDEALTEDGAADLQSILSILRTHVGYNFECYKRGTLARRVQRRMGLGQFATYASYAEYLQSHPSELDELFKDLLICITQFFRDREAWQKLAADIIPEIVSRASSGGSIRVWVPACATGEEAYSIAMLVLEELRTHEKDCVLQVFASDINESALEVGRLGMYPASIATDVPAPLLERYFVEGTTDRYYSVSRALREVVIFARQNLVVDPPFSKLDLVCCRNLLIYVEPDIQQKVIELFHFALRPGGFLFLGSAETIGRHDRLFVSISKKWRIFRRGDESRQVVAFPLAASHVHERPRPSATPAQRGESRVARMAQQLLLEKYAPAAVLVTERFEIIYFTGRTQEYLVQPTGAPTNDLLAMAREGLRTKIRAAATQAIHDGRAVTVDNVRVRRGTHFHPARLTVNPIHTESGDGPLLLVVFEDERPAESPATAHEEPPADEAVVRQLEYELILTREDLQSHIEDLETSNEDLKVATEEVMSVNEELQSANEELETSKEELQSLNEEVSTVNCQLREKIAELERINNDLDNLLTSTDIATIFLDRELRIKRFTPAVRRLMNVIATDVDRPLADFARRFTDRRLLQDAQQVLERLIPAEVEIRTDDGRWFLRRVLPYRTEDNRIDGVVITFIDTSATKLAVEALAESESRYRMLIDSATDFAIFMLDLEGRITTWNSGSERICGYTEREALGKPGSIIFVPEDRESGEDMHELERARRTGRSEDERWHLRKDGSRFWGSGVVMLVYDDQGRPVGFSKVMRDQTERRRMEAELHQLNDSLEQMVQERTASLSALSSELLIAEERERRELASDLHDSIGQTLALASMRLGELGPGVPPETRAELGELINSANEAVRSVTMQLSPPILYQLGLVPALEWLADEMERRYGLIVALEHRDVPAGIDDQVRFILFRSARELLINVAKHAEVSDARVRVGSVGGFVVLEIEDSGKGFPATAEFFQRRSGFGLFSLRERLRYIGGEVIIRSTQGLGTTVTLRAPVTIQ
jgi:two-component system CheB/CheR fusion protein